MNGLDWMLAICLWACLGGVLYAYLLYPVVVWCLARRFGKQQRAQSRAADEWPSVSLVIAAYNEAAVIEERILNTLALDYPADKLEILIASDGSSDATPEIVRRYEDRGVRLLDFQQRRGKASVLNSALPEARGDIVLLSDANTMFDPDAVRQLVRWFCDPRVGAVCGRLVLVDPRTGGNVDGLYWKYETFLKKCEGRLGALLGTNGAIYALRKELYVPIPANTIVDDFVIPLLAKLRHGCEIVYECGAVAREETAPNVGCEFRRRTRIGAGGFQSIGLLWKLLDPRRGWVAYTFLSHKILRWVCPFFLLGALATNLLLWPQPFYRGLLAAQLAFYQLSFLITLVPSRVRLLKPLRLTTMFTSMNLALFLGFCRWLRGTQKSAWQRTPRLSEAQGVTR
jgi:cellulose synthase/poly-beta-1,6-N-acetylglucosamine synthase-like glycosyltransferase